MRITSKTKIAAMSLLNIALTFLISPFAQAQILPDCVKEGDCTVCSMVQTGINLGAFVLGIVGSLALLFFVYGGFMMLLSGGKSDWIKKGKDIIVNSVIGIAIVLFAYVIVTFVVTAVTKQGWNWTANLGC